MISYSNITDDTRIIDLTVGEFKALCESFSKPIKSLEKEKKCVYGLSGIAELFHCSKSAAFELKKSGKIDKAIIQDGRKIIVDKDMALKLVGEKNK